MGRFVVSANVTLDGIGQDPTGEEGFKLGGRFQMTDGDCEAWAKTEYNEALCADAYLLGGRTYEWFAQRWVEREGAWARRLRELPKYVVRSTGGRSDWGPTTVLRGTQWTRRRSRSGRSPGTSSCTAATSSCARCWTTISSTKYGWSSSRVWSGPVVASSAS